MKTDLAFIRQIGVVCFLFFALTEFGHAQVQPLSQNSQPSEAQNITTDLMLTREQIEQLALLSQSLVRPTVPLGRDLTQAKKKLDQLLASSSASTGEIREQYRRVELIRQAIERLSVEYRIGTREILTPEQRPKYEEYMRQRFEQSPSR